MAEFAPFHFITTNYPIARMVFGKINLNLESQVPGFAKKPAAKKHCNNLEHLTLRTEEAGGQGKWGWGASV